MATLLQITDCHLVAPGAKLIGVDTQASLAAVLQQATQRREFDGIVATGDIAHDPQPDIYARFIATVREFSDAPLLCLPGNHDVLAHMQQAGLPDRTLELGNWSVVALDSHIDETVASAITDDDKRNVALALQEARGDHVLIATHHPLVEVNCPWLDKDRIQDAADLLDWLAGCIRATGRDIALRGAIFGHAHQVVTGRIENWPLLGCPSTCFQFMPESPKFALDDKSPGYRVLELRGDGRLAGSVERTRFPIDPRSSRTRSSRKR